MAIDLAVRRRDPDVTALETPARRQLRRPRLVVGILGFSVFAAALGYVAGNEVQANAQFDQAHSSLVTTRAQIRAVLGDLAAVRHNLGLVRGQMNADTAALAQDGSQLKGVETALANARAGVTSQSVTISELQSCLSGVEQASNALAVSDQSGAIVALSAVSQSCTSVVASSG